MRVLVIGGGKLGRAVAERLAKDSHAVRVLARRQLDWSLPGGAELTLGSALDSAAIREALSGRDVAINTIGSRTLRTNTVESDATRAAVDAATALGTQRYFGMSAGMVEPINFFFDHVLGPTLFRNLIREHQGVERIIRRSSLDWTILRPSLLSDGPAKGYRESVDPTIDRFGRTTRADIADFMARELINGRYHRQAVFLISGPPIATPGAAKR